MALIVPKQQSSWQPSTLYPPSDHSYVQVQGQLGAQYKVKCPYRDCRLHLHSAQLRKHINKDVIKNGTFITPQFDTILNSKQNTLSIMKFEQLREIEYSQN